MSLLTYLRKIFAIAGRLHYVLTNTKSIISIEFAEAPHIVPVSAKLIFHITVVF